MWYNQKGVVEPADEMYRYVDCLSSENTYYKIHDPYGFYFSI